jgi:hypothetical protein
MSDWKCLRFFYDAFENGKESLDERYKGLFQQISFDWVLSIGYSLDGPGLLTGILCFAARANNPALSVS